jgi:mannosyltransferase
MKRNWLLYAIILIGAILRIIGIGWDALWYDEAFTAWLARSALPQMMDAIAGDVHPPAWYLIEWVIIRLFGSSEIALRAPACLIGIVNLWLAWIVARRLAPRSVAVLATGIFAFAPFQIYYSQEARMYQLLQFAVLLAIWAVLARRWVVLAGAGLLGLLTHNLMAIYLVNIFGLAIWQDRGYFRVARRLQFGWFRTLNSWGATWAGLAIIINYVPWAWWLLLPQIGEVNNGFWVQPLAFGGLFYPFYILVYHVSSPAWLQLHAGILIMAFIIWGTFKTWHDHRAIIILAWGPVIILALISMFWRPVYLHRTLIGAALPIYLLMAFAIVRVARVLAQPVGMVALVLSPMLLIPAGAYYLSQDARRWDVRQDAAVTCQPGDVMYHVNLGSLILFQYYLPECDHWVWPAANDLSQSLTQRTKQAMGMQQAELNDISTWQRTHHAWLIWSETPVMNGGEPGTVGKILLLNNYALVHQAEPVDLVTLRIWEVWR